MRRPRVTSCGYKRALRIGQPPRQGQGGGGWRARWRRDRAAFKTRELCWDPPRAPAWPGAESPEGGLHGVGATAQGSPRERGLWGREESRQSCRAGRSLPGHLGPLSPFPSLQNGCIRGPCPLGRKGGWREGRVLPGLDNRLWALCARPTPPAPSRALQKAWSWLSRPGRDHSCPMPKRWPLESILPCPREGPSLAFPASRHP